MGGLRKVYCAKLGHHQKECRHCTQDRQNKQVKPTSRAVMLAFGCSQTGRARRTRGRGSSTARHWRRRPRRCSFRLVAQPAALQLCVVRHMRSPEFVSPCRPFFAPHVPRREMGKFPLTQEGGTRATHHGARTVKERTATGDEGVFVQGTFEVKVVTRPILPVGSVVDSGHCVVAPPRFLGSPCVPGRTRGRLTRRAEASSS